MDRLAEQIGEKGKIGIVSGESTATNLNSWISWIEKQQEEKYPDIEIVDIRYTQGGSSEQALKQAQELMTRYSDLKGLVAVAYSMISFRKWADGCRFIIWIWRQVYREFM